MAYRVTPTTITGCSPSELIQGRRIKTVLPIPPHNLLPKLPDSVKLPKRHQKVKHNQKIHFDKRNGVQNLKALKPGDKLRIRSPCEKIGGPEVRARGVVFDHTWWILEMISSEEIAGKYNVFPH